MAGLGLGFARLTLVAVALTTCTPGALAAMEDDPVPAAALTGSGEADCTTSGTRNFAPQLVQPIRTLRAALVVRVA